MEINYSLIIPHFNIPHLLERLINTIPRRSDLQVIIVDDCSTNNKDVLNLLMQEYAWIEWYTTGTNGGGGKARNIGLEHAKGKYILFADADDFFTPGISMILDRYKNTEFDMLVFNAISLDSESYEISYRASDLDNWIRQFQRNEKKYLNKIKYVFGEPWCRLVRRQLIIDNKIYFQQVKCHNDTKFAYLIGHFAKSIKVDSTIGYVVTFRKNSVINTNYSDRYDIVADVFSEKQQFLLDHNIKTIVADLYAPLVHDLIRLDITNFRKKYNLLAKRNLKQNLIYSILKQFIYMGFYKIGSIEVKL